MKSIKVAITGASGYIGSYLVSFLQQRGHRIYEMGRKRCHTEPEFFIPFELGKENHYQKLQKIDVLVHCAYDFSPKTMEEIRSINVAGSIDLLQHAKNAGVSKIIYISSTSSFPEATSNYGRAKYEIELFAEKTGIEIIRPGLVFMKDPKGIIGALNNFVKKFPCIPMVGRGDQIFFPTHLFYLFT